MLQKASYRHCQLLWPGASGINFILLCLLITLSGLAIGKPLITDNTDLESLASTEFWQKLVHYKPDSTMWFDRGVASVQSEVVTDQFFLSPIGRTNPYAELKATVNAMRAEEGDDPNLHAQCRFPARLHWLKKHVPSLAAPDIDCPDYSYWSKENNVESISLFYAMGYLGNPASYYGHILLRLNAGSNKGISDLLSTSVDYGAINIDQDSALIYIAKGLFGGYEAGFTHEQFYRQDHNYGEDQLRDLWEYRLNLTDEQRMLITAHSWELIRNKFVYYFFKHNCAYAMAEMIQLVIDEPLYSKRLPWTIPHAVFDYASDAKNQNESLVENVIYHPSLQSRMRGKYSQLNRDEKLFVAGFVNGDYGFQSHIYRKRPPDSRIKILDVMVLYFQYRIVSEPENQALQLRKQSVLQERLQLPGESMGGHAANIRDSKIVAPHMAQSPSTTRIGALYNTTLGHGERLQIRPAYFDTLSLDVARPANASLAMANLEVSRFKDVVNITRFDLINLEALNTSFTGLPGDGSYSWRLNIGARKQNLECKHCLVPGIEAGIGQSMRLRSYGVFYYGIDGRLQTSYEGSGAVAVAPHVGVISRERRYGKTALKVSYRDYIEDNESGDLLWRIEHRFGRGQDWDIRVRYERDRAEQFLIEYSMYWK